MATIYRFIVEQKSTGNGGQRATKGSAKKGRKMPLLGGSKGGVEHNRKMRAINPILNKLTGGVWEKATRISRAGIGMMKNVGEKGAKGLLSGPALYIIIAFILMTVWNAVAKQNQIARQQADKLNAENYKKLENGSSAIHGSYKIMIDGWSGRITYNENK